MLPVASHLDLSVVTEHPYLFAAIVFTIGGYRLIREVFRLGYGIWVTMQTPENAAAIIAATLHRPRRRLWRKPPPKGG